MMCNWRTKTCPPSLNASLDPAANGELAVLLADLVARLRRSRRAGQDSAVAQSEPTVVPRALDAVVEHRPLVERSAAMTATSTDGVPPVARPGHQQRLTTDGRVAAVEPRNGLELAIERCPVLGVAVERVDVHASARAVHEMATKARGDSRRRRAGHGQQHAASVMAATARPPGQGEQEQPGGVE